MPNTAQGHNWKFQFAKQDAEGTAETTADYQVPSFGGTILPVQQTQQYEVADGNPYRPGLFKLEGHVEGSPILPSFPDSGGMLSYLHLGTDTITGAADPWTHDLTRAATQPWATFWVHKPEPAGTYDIDQWFDCRVKAVEIQGEQGQPIRLASEILGKRASNDASAPTVTTTNVLDGTEKHHSMVGAVLDLDLDTTPAATQIRNVTSFTVRMDYPNLTFLQTDEFRPRYVDQGLWEVSFSADLILEDYASYKNTFFGSKTATGQDLSQTFPAGALDFTLTTAPTADANRTLQIQIPAMYFTATPPEPDISGAGLRVSLAGTLKQPAAGEPITVTYLNDVSVAYSA